MDKENGAPRCCGDSGSCLGVRIGTGKYDDIATQEDGHVHPRTGGLSVSPDDPKRLPRHRRPRSLGGDSTRPLWVVSHEQLQAELHYEPDEPDPEGIIRHGLVEPGIPMPPEALQEHLRNTTTLWHEVT
jgi:hypothetical protein